MTGFVPPLAEWPLVTVTTHCQRETERYRRDRQSDGRFCLEIFRRALRAASAHHDQRDSLLVDESWTILVQLYTPFVETAINRAALRGLSLSDTCQQVWLRFWQAARGNLEFPTLEAALAYLRRVVVTTLVEERRRAAKEWRETALPTMLDNPGESLLADPGADLFDYQVRRLVRERCAAVLTNSLHHQVFWLNSNGYPAREIARLLHAQGIEISGRTPTPRAVSDILERGRNRLKSDPQMRELLSGD